MTGHFHQVLSRYRRQSSEKYANTTTVTFPGQRGKMTPRIKYGKLIGNWKGGSGVKSSFRLLFCIIYIVENDQTMKVSEWFMHGLKVRLLFPKNTLLILFTDPPSIMGTLQWPWISLDRGAIAKC